MRCSVCAAFTSNYKMRVKSEVKGQGSAWVFSKPELCFLFPSNSSQEICVLTWKRRRSRFAEVAQTRHDVLIGAFQCRWAGFDTCGSKLPAFNFSYYKVFCFLFNWMCRQYFYVERCSRRPTGSWVIRFWMIWEAAGRQAANSCWYLDSYNRGRIPLLLFRLFIPSQSSN